MKVQVKKEDIILQVLERVKYVLDIRATLADDAELLHYGMDSVSVINLIVELEEYFGIQFEQNELLYENFNSVQNVVGIVVRKSNK